jgi:putative ABC transport system permease protein
MSTLTQDIRFAVRSLARQPGFTLAAVLTLALGIGANTAIFSVVDSVLLQPPPFRDPGRIMVVWAVNPEIAQMVGENDLPVSRANIYDFQQASAFEGLSQVQQDKQSLTGQGEPEQLRAVLVSPDFFKILGTPALVGRTLGPDDETPGAPLAAVLSYNYWQRRFACDPAVVGKTFILNDKPLTVAGVMPPRFAFPRGSEVPSILAFSVDPDVWVPMAYTAEQRGDRGNRVSFLIGKVKPGVSPQAAEQELNAISKRLGEQFPDSDKGWTVRLVPVVEQMNQGLRPILVVLWTVVGLVLLIACVNVANLLLARASSRQKEIALRTAIGAGRGRLMAQLLTESAVLSTLGGVLGIFLAWAFLRLCAANIPSGLAGAATFSLDGRALLFTVLLVALATLLAGLVPAFQVSRPDLSGTLREGTRAGAGTVQSRRTRSALVVAEVAIAVAVLFGTGLVMKSFLRLMDVDPGFRPQNVLTFKIDMPADRAPDQLSSFYTRLEHELGTVPGVTSAAVISDLPMGGGDNLTAVLLEGKPAPKQGEMLIAGGQLASSRYFETLGIEIRKGRSLQPGDTRDKPLVAVIDEAMAKAYWPGEEALGRRFRRLDAAEPLWVTVVGIAENIRHGSLYSEPRPTVYMTPDQTTKYFMPYQAWAAVRTKGDPRALISSVRQAVARVDRNQPLALIRPMDEVVAQSISKNRLSLLLLAILAVLALVLAVIGIYGITAYSVNQRTREIGLRLALGAPPGEVLRLIVREAGVLALAGIGLGVILSIVLARVAATQLSALLYKIQSTDPMTFVSVAVVLILVALGAAWFPGRRATKVSPMVALRAD